MIHSLKVKLAASHTLPILVLMPVLTLFLLYTIEGLLNQTLLHEMKNEAFLLRDIMASNPATLDNHDARQAFLAQASRLTGARVLLISPDSVILDASRNADTERVGTRLDDPTIAQALSGLDVEWVGPGFTSEVAYVVLPLQYNGVTKGVMRLSYEISDVRARFDQLERLVLAGTGLTLIMGVGIGLGLATTITRPLYQLGESAKKIAAGNYRARASVNTKDEVGTLAQHFNRMAERLEEVEHSRARQLAAIVHELARPITGMRAAVDTLRDHADPDAAARESLVEGISDELARLQRLIGTLQQLQKRNLRPLELNRTDISLERVIRSSAANFQLRAAESEIDLEIEITLPLPLICADEDRLIQVLTNLLDNAFKFSPRHGRVLVRAGLDPRGTWVSVLDSGPGIASEELPFIFQEFYRGEIGHAPEKRGMGLGLAICRDIITAHGGTISVASPPGSGTCITFTLPVSNTITQMR